VAGPLFVISTDLNLGLYRHRFVPCYVEARLQYGSAAAPASSAAVPWRTQTYTIAKAPQSGRKL